MKMRLAFRFGVITVTDGTQAVIRVRISLPDGRTEPGRGGRGAGRQVVREEPGLHRRAESRPAPPGARSRDRALSARRASTRRSVCSPAPTPSSTSAARRWASIRWSRPTGRRCSTAPSSTRWARRRAIPSPPMIARNVPGIRTTELTPDIGRLRSRALPGRPAARQPASSVRHTVGLVDPLTAGDRPAIGARQRRPAGDAGGGRLLLSRPLLQAEGRRRHQGRSRSAEPHRRRARRRRRRLPHHARRQRAVRRRRGHRRAVAQGRARRRRWPGSRKSTLFIEQPIKRAWRSAARSTPLAKLRPLIIDESDGELSSFPTALALGYCRRLEQELQGLLQVDPQRRARRASSAPGHFMSAEDLTTWPGVSVQQDLALVSLLGLDPCRAQRPSLHRRHVASRRRPSSTPSWRPIPTSTRSRTASRRGSRRSAASWRCGSLDVPGFAVGAEMDFAACAMTPHRRER